MSMTNYVKVYVVPAGWRREYLNDDYFKMIMETPGGDSFLTRR